MLISRLKTGNGLRRCKRAGVRLASMAVRAPAPAICAVQIAPREDKRDEVERWLSEGRVILEKTLRSHRAASSAVAAHIVGSDVRSCFHWVHMPSSSEKHPDTVAIVFTSDTDLSLWRQSPQRAAWLESGVQRGLAKDDASMLIDAERIQLQKDDGSLGGWLPSEGDADAAAGRRDLVAPPPSWKVAATVLLAMYPVQELNRVLVLPTLAASPLWAELHPTVQVFAACAWTCGAVTVVLLPHARQTSEGIGFIGGSRGCPDPASLARATGKLLLLYGGLVVVGLGLSAAVGPVRPAGVWSSLPPQKGSASA